MRLLLLSLLVSCASTHHMGELSINEKDYINKVKEANSDFMVSNSRANQAWRRGVDFVKKHSSMQVDSSASNYIFTKDPNVSDNKGIGYLLTRNRQGGRTKISIRCMYPVLGGLKFTKEVCRSNEQYMSHYMRTGKIIDKFVNSVVAPGKNSRRKL